MDELKPCRKNSDTTNAKKSTLKDQNSKRKKSDNSAKFHKKNNNAKNELENLKNTASVP